ncbi:MAG: hypothetical protein M3T55_00465 [Pseudomonadota bacterium]|nr:hypothetical protein [Pseudomonadota bacterium]
MNKNQSGGAAKVVLGKVEAAAGEELGDPLIRARGAALQVEGRVQEAAGSVQEALGQAADRARAVVSKGSDAYGSVSSSARGLMRTIEGEPFMTMAVGVAVGLLAGLFIAAKRTKVIYVKPRA